MTALERTECTCGFIFIGDGGGRPCVHRDDGGEHRTVTVNYIPAAGAVVLDDDLLTNLDQRAARSHTDRAGYLRWVLTGKAPAAEEVT